MIRRVFLVIAIAFVSPVAFAETPKGGASTEKDSHSIFNGTDLSGWNGDPQYWKVTEGVIRGETTPENPAKGNTFLIYTGETPKDFELKLEFRCTADNNSGIQYRSKHIKDDTARNSWVVRGYQHELRNEQKFPNVSGFIYDEGGKRGRVCLLGEKGTWETDGKKVVDTLITEEEYQKLFKLDDWNEVTIVAKGNHIQHFMNGKLVLDFTDNAPELKLLDGIIALQLHAGKPMWAEFRNISLKGK